MISRRILRIKILQLLYAFYKSLNTNLNKAEKELFHSINKTYELYHYLLLLVTDIADHAFSRIEIAKQKNFPSYEDLHPNTKFIDNKIINQIRINKQLTAYLNGNKMSWVNYPELVKKIFQGIKDSEHYKSYMNNSECSESLKKT